MNYLSDLVDFDFVSRVDIIIIQESNNAPMERTIIKK